MHMIIDAGGVAMFKVFVLFGGWCRGIFSVVKGTKKG